ncbi:MAG: spore coat protein CotJB [Lachnospiraceae bacterium]|nr:spore coat protein CotJB [Lachnospiraceae bacterium]MEE1341374.1 spore coat protein CotJB [Lachnospiraceae bacterium]
MNTMVSQKSLLKYIYEVSFAVNDITLYLDTHPEDEEALQYFCKYKTLREKALKEYAHYFGPLTLDSATCSSKWSWGKMKNPWEVE